MQLDARDTVKHLENKGYHFTSFRLSIERDTHLDDIEFNYKDVAHLDGVHKLEIVLPVIKQDMHCSIVLQRVLCFRIPMIFNTFFPSSDRAFYYSAWLFFVIVVESAWNKTSASTTRVETHYSIGSFFPWKYLAPLICWFLKKNHSNLMKEDFPIRDRRTHLRTKNYSFSSPQDVRQTCLLNENHVKWKDAKVSFRDTCLDLFELKEGQKTQLGENDHLGLLVFRNQGNILVFPRMCFHEGASLEEELPINCELTCPWHGRKTSSLLSIDLKSMKDCTYQTQFHKFQIVSRNLFVSLRPYSIY